MVRFNTTMHITMGMAFSTLCFDKASNAGVQLVTHQNFEKSKNQMQFFAHISLCGSAGLKHIVKTTKPSTDNRERKTRGPQREVLVACEEGRCKAE